MATNRRWQDRLTFVLGLWLFVSPMFYGGTFTMDAMTVNTLVLGVAVMIFSGAALARYQPWEEWLETLFGVWLIFSPFIFSFTDMTFATINHIAVGAVIVIDSLWVALKYPTSGHPAH
ncbi:MAG: SPW repeat protein [Acidiferrobacterales bacterium]|nr:SPW repeat protein [Acidiferrobacterales bacterium]